MVPRAACLLLFCAVAWGDDPLWGITGTQHLPRVAAAGLRGVRFDISWRAVEPRVGEGRSWEHYDRLLARVARHGLVPHAIVANGFIGHAPLVLHRGRWVRLTPDVVGQRTYIELAARHTRAVVLRYAKQVPWWQIENEPNVAGPTVLYRWREGRVWWDERFVGALLAALSRAVKDASPAAQVVINFHTDVPLWPAHVRRWRAQYDLCGIDAYPNYLAAGRPRADLLEQRLRQARRVAGKPVIVSETGCPGRSAFGGHSPGFQARYVEAAARVARRAGVRAFYLFRDSSSEQPRRTGSALLDRLQAVEGFFGVIRPSGAPHPAFERYAAVIRERQ